MAMPRRYPLLTGLFLTLVVAGCAPKTTVVLLADGEGRVGMVRVANDSGSVELDQPAQGTVVSGAKGAPAAPESWSQARIDATFATVLTSLPTAPEHFLLYFNKGTSELTGDSAALLPEIQKTIDRRNAVDIRIIGHSDTAGNPEFNLRLSQERAFSVTRILIDRGVPETHLFTTSHGENNPLIVTPDGVDEPRNRRVEVVVK
jgi:outer membrane protein OmpA-like peptidoglycan-associated protein